MLNDVSMKRRDFCIDYYLTVLFRGKIVRLNLKLLNLKQLSIFSRLLNCNTHHLNQNSSQIYVDDDNYAFLDKDDLFLMVNESVAYR